LVNEAVTSIVYFEKLSDKLGENTGRRILMISDVVGWGRYNIVERTTYGERALFMRISDVMWPL
jgi:hypothetical protein